MVKVRDLCHRFGDHEVLHDINLEVGAGEIVAIMGSSGGGKTTLLKCISGLLRPTSGDVLVDGISVQEQPDEARSRLGLVFQNAALFDYLNVSDNVIFGIKRKRRIPHRERQALVAEKLAQVGLEGTEALMPSELSGGMRKRVGLARALAMEPKILLYDEPTSGLDPVTAYSIDRLIVDTRDRTGMTSVVVSHDVSSVFRVADRIAFLDDGRLLFVGEPTAFREEQNAAIRELLDKSQTERLGHATEG